jgi:uroporphyrinogen-III decarboxylase
MTAVSQKLISYIAPAAPATRRPASGQEAFLRPEIGFTPAWYAQQCNICFDQRWHSSVQYRQASLRSMHRALQQRFPGTKIGQSLACTDSLDLLTGVFGCNVITAVFGIPMVYDRHTWPVVQAIHLTTTQLEALAVPDLKQNSFFQDLMIQVDQIAERQGPVTGFINWQGILNNALKLRGQQIFLDLLDKPALCHQLFACICETMINGLQLLHEKQRSTGVDYDFATVSNCCVNMLSPDQYAEFILPYDMRIAQAFAAIGIHNCAWNADPYMEHYAAIPHLGYIDMGLSSDLARARALMPNARRALMYTPMDLAHKSRETIHRDIEWIVDSYAPCDIVVADIDNDVPDERVIAFVELCQRYNERNPA